MESNPFRKTQRQTGRAYLPQILGPVCRVRITPAGPNSDPKLGALGVQIVEAGNASMQDMHVDSEVNAGADPRFVGPGGKAGGYIMAEYR